MGVACGPMVPSPPEAPEVLATSTMPTSPGMHMEVTVEYVNDSSEVLRREQARAAVGNFETRRVDVVGSSARPLLRAWNPAH